MLVVSDTSPLRGLSVIEKLDLIPALYGEVLLPPAVEAELAAPVANLPLIAPNRFPFLRVRTPSDAGRVAALRVRLNQGEAEAIALALEVRADGLLIDERRGRSIAAELGVRTIGLLGVLVEAKSRDLVPALAPLVEVLRARIGFRIDAALLASVLRRVGEA